MKFITAKALPDSSKMEGACHQSKFFTVWISFSVLYYPSSMFFLRRGEDARQSRTSSLSDYALDS
jgi:hypothetical protein